MIPSHWFDTDHDLHRIAWHLYDNQEHINEEFMDGLVTLLQDMEGEFIEVDYKHPQAGNPLSEFGKQAIDNVLKKFQEKEMKRREKMDPIMQLVEGTKPLSNSLYDYVNADEAVKLIEAEENRLKTKQPKKKFKGKSYEKEEIDPHRKKEPKKKKTKK